MQVSLLFMFFTNKINGWRVNIYLHIYFYIWGSQILHFFIYLFIYFYGYTHIEQHDWASLLFLVPTHNTYNQSAH